MNLRFRSGGRIYYGWVIVAVMGTTGAVSMAMGTLNFGLFIKPMGDELGIGRSTFGWAATARQFSSSVTSPIIGPLIDRYGVRIMLPIAALFTGGAMIGLAYVEHAWQLVLWFSVMGLVGMSGPGALVTSVPVLKWFVRNRGKAVAFMSLGIPAGALVFVPLTQVLIDHVGWRVPVSLIFVRRQPEDVGLLPDGDVPDEVAVVTGPRWHMAEELSFTSGQAVRTINFWSLVVVFSMVMLAMGIIGVHRIPAFLNRGVDAGLVSLATAFDAVVAGVATFAFGFSVRKVPVRFLGCLGFIFLAIASVITIYADNFALVFISMAVFGAGVGGMMFLHSYIWAEYFGREHLGSIRGLVMPINLVVGGAGAPIAGYVHESTGSYDSVWWVGVGLMIAAAVLVLLTRAPRSPAVSRPDRL
jgi:MFS family permease